MKQVVLFMLFVALAGILAFIGYSIWFELGPSAIVTTSCNGTISKIVACPDCAGGINRYLVIFRTASGDVVPVNEKLSREIIDSGAYFNQVLRIEYETLAYKDRAGKLNEHPRHRLIHWRKPYPLEVGQ